MNTMMYYGKISKNQYDWERIPLETLVLARHLRPFSDYLHSTKNSLAVILPQIESVERKLSEETPFLADQLSEYSDPSILDISGRCGAIAIALGLKGFQELLVGYNFQNQEEPVAAVAEEEAEKYGVQLRTTTINLRKLIFDTNRKEFDVVLCLNGALSQLFRKEEQKLALVALWARVSPGGKLIIDELNHSGLYERVFVPLMPQKVVLQASPPKTSGVKYYLVRHDLEVTEYWAMYEGDIFATAYEANYSFKDGELQRLLSEVVGLYQNDQITSFGDYKPCTDFKKAKKIMHIAKRQG